MKTANIVSVFFCLTLFATITDAQPIVFTANLNQAQAGGTGSAAIGFAVLSYDAAVTELNVSVRLGGVATASITGFHIREAPAGAVGPIIFGMVNPNHDANDFVDQGTGYFSIWDDPDTATGAAFSPGSLQVITSLASERYYLNAETAAFPNGEIRGQIVPVLFGDVNLDGSKDLFDVQPFFNLLISGGYQIEADIDFNGVLDLLDAFGFIDALATGC